LFQSGRFKRLVSVRPTDQGSALGLAQWAGESPWFSAVPAARAATAKRELVLGSPALGDLALQVVQACVPGQRLTPAAWDEIWFSASCCAGMVPDGQVTIRASQSVQSSWDVQVSDQSGITLISWRGLRMRDAGPLQGFRPTSLLAAHRARAVAKTANQSTT